jgi:hypothetical protein
MDLSSLFNDPKVIKGTHVVMKSVGLEKGGDLKGWIHAPKLNANNDQAHELYPVNRVKAMEEQGWQLVKQVKEPTDAKTPRKVKENVEG